MIALPNSAANLAQTEDVVTKYANLFHSGVQLGLALSVKQKLSTYDLALVQCPQHTTYLNDQAYTA